MAKLPGATKAEGKTSWVPFRTSFDLQRQGIGSTVLTSAKSENKKGVSAGGGDDDDGDGSPLRDLVRDLQLKQEHMSEQQSKMLELLSSLLLKQQQEEQGRG